MNVKRFMGNKRDYLVQKFITNLKKAVAIRKDKIIQE